MDKEDYDTRNWEVRNEKVSVLVATASSLKVFARDLGLTTESCHVLSVLKR